MKKLLLIVLTFSLSGCLMELLTVTAIQGELAGQNAQSATRALSYAKESVATTELRHAIDSYAAETGYYPSSLNALVPEYLVAIPRQSDGTPYGYDSQTGALLSGPAPTSQTNVSFTGADQRNLQALRDAIYTYWESTRYYPTRLGDLQPIYIQRVPLLSSGAEFIYDPETGSVFHPAELANASSAPRRTTSRRGGAPAGGAGMMGEVMTGIAISNELDGMNQSGTSAAGSRSRRSVNDISSRNNQRQMKALRDLDLD